MLQLPRFKAGDHIGPSLGPTFPPCATIALFRALFFGPDSLD